MFDRRLAIFSASLPRILRVLGHHSPPLCGGSWTPRQPFDVRNFCPRGRLPVLMKIARDSVVTLDYKLTNDAGEVLDESEGEPLTYIHGHGQLVPGLESALEGKDPGTKMKVDVAPKDGYGERVGSKLLEIPRDEFPEGEHVEPGMAIEAVGNDGKTVTLWIVDSNDDHVSVSLDH